MWGFALGQSRTGPTLLRDGVFHAGRLGRRLSRWFAVHRSGVFSSFGSLELRGCSLRPPNDPLRDLRCSRTLVGHDQIIAVPKGPL